MMYGKVSLLLALALTSAQAFSVSPSSRHVAASKTRFYMSDMGDDFPSDSSSAATIDIMSEALMPTMSEGIVSSIFDELPEGLVTSVSKETRANINEAILKLEKMNPTEDPASSPLLNGVWNLRYAGGYDDDWALQSPTRQIALFAYSGGYSPGLFALSLASSLPSGLVELGELEIAISREQPRIEAKIDVKFLGGASNDVVVKASLKSKSAIRLTETYESATLLGQSIDLPEAVQYSRDLYIAYLDEDILIVRDGSGVPEILVRKQ
jgi:hypothetical protein